MTLRKPIGGFSLIELSIVLVILSVMLGGIMSAVTQNVRLKKQAELNMKMDAIERALKIFRIKFDRLPCPAEPSMTSIQRGTESTTPGACTGGSPSALENYAGSTAIGAVPVYTLGLPEDYMYDPWGNRFGYFVYKNATATAAFTTYPAPAELGAYVVHDYYGGIYTSAATVLLISYGPNGHGAFQANGTRKSGYNINTAEQANCGCDQDGIAASYMEAYAGDYIMLTTGDLGTAFDDTVRFYLRGDFPSAAEERNYERN